MTAKMLKANGQILHRTTYRALTDRELNEKKKLEKERNLMSRYERNWEPKWTR